MLIKRALTLAACSVILLIIIIGAFPNSFADESRINVSGIKMMPPNLGKNRITITNPQAEAVRIEKMELQNIRLFENVLIEPSGSHTEVFDGEEIDDLRKRILIVIHPSSESVQRDIKNESESLITRRGREASREPKHLIVNINGKEFSFTNIRPPRYITEEINYIEDTNLRKRSLFGTDKMLGRDIWTRFVFGTNIILRICLFSFFISAPIGLTLGLLHGYYEGWLKFLLDGFTGLFNSLPIYLVAMLIIGSFGENFWWMVIAISSVQWIEIEKVIYEEVQKQKRNDFIRSSKLFGRPNIKVLWQDIFILCIPHILVGSLFFFKRIILVESALSYLGYSVTIPYATWGNILMDIHLEIFKPLSNWWWILLWPSLAIIMTSLSLNVIENRLKEHYNVGN